MASCGTIAARHWVHTCIEMSAPLFTTLLATSSQSIQASRAAGSTSPVSSSVHAMCCMVPRAAAGANLGLDSLRLRTREYMMVPGTLSHIV